jgi:phospholipase/carboxylesterase
MPEHLTTPPPLETIEIDTGPNPRAAIVFLHGLGADGHDFEPLARELDLRAVGSVRWVFPHAPMRPVTINGGYVMRAWYDILGTELVRREDEAGLRASQAAIGQLIDAQCARGIAAGRVVLGGFSQGCAMALLTGLRRRERLAGIVGLSGYLPLAASTAAERSDANALAPVFLAHGRLDAIVPLARAAASRDLLRALGYDLQWREYPIDHGVSPAELADLRAFLLQVLAPV